MSDLSPGGPGPATGLASGLTFDDLGEGLGTASTVLRGNAGSAGLHASVPTCPGWTVLDLVAHQGMVHRWATSQVRGTPEGDPERFEAEGRAAADVLEWFDAGATGLLQALVDAPDDLEALTFLHDAPAPRVFWARRQCHETTVHAVDAMAARLGRAPRPEETWLRPHLAADGIDELLTGFVPRRKQGAQPRRPTRVLVRPDDASLAWLLDLAPDRPATTTRLTDVEALGADADAAWTGGTVELFLRLWSRTDAEPADALERWWRDTVSVTW
ncbi:maleylpyruvate isomerase N-terminal domain-containing protein [Intrasporangium flavum]|uniref:maleylpyruvate isomerase N-terminal domain-containing protein n=1 Tax=Intrasporangium flavum TaxID=1428657 RepID=UPI001F60502A|nr:maleylpyruvate isomerase N-terminal domain-containing protein [Intrasporangium flavum]